MAFIYSNDHEMIMNTTITEHGKKKLMMSSSLGISKFALSDDGINYKILHNDSGSIDSVGIKMLPLIESPVNYEIKYTLCPGKENMLKSEIQTTVIPEDVTLAQTISGSIIFNDKTSVKIDVYVLNPNIDESKYILTAMLTDTLGILDLESDLSNNQSEYDDFNNTHHDKKIISFKNSFKVIQTKLCYRQQNTKIKISPSELLLVNDKEIDIMVKGSTYKHGVNNNA